MARDHLSGRPNQDPVGEAWNAYMREADSKNACLTRKEERETKATLFTENLKEFLNAAEFLKVSTTRQIRRLGISRRTYFYWVKAVREGKSLSVRVAVSYKLWLVWKSLEQARFKFQTIDLATSWFNAPNPLLSKAGLRPIELLFNYNVRRRPRALRVLLEMPAPASVTGSPRRRSSVGA